MNVGSDLDLQRFPATRHVPGSGSHPDRIWLGQIVAETPVSIINEHWQENIPYCYGWRLFRYHYYWEAHEVWEAVWMQATPQSLERQFLQAMIQLTNACLKRRQGKHRAVSRILTLVTDQLYGDYGHTTYMGVDVYAVRTLIRSINS